MVLGTHSDDLFSHNWLHLFPLDCAGRKACFGVLLAIYFSLHCEFTTFCIFPSFLTNLCSRHVLWMLTFGMYAVFTFPPLC